MTDESTWCPCGHWTGGDYACLNGNIYGPCRDSNCSGVCADTHGICREGDGCACQEEDGLTDPLEYLREAHARADQAALAATDGPWEARPPTDDGAGWEIRAVVTPGREWRWIVGAESGGGVYDEADARHIELHQPRAVLRRITAERKILAEHADDGHGDCKRCAGEGREAELYYNTKVWVREDVAYPCDTVRALAEAWGWQEEEQQ